ncbi:lipase class 3 family protein [Amylostereum chailletii]|nr:lipase class 3 family protein [Amylostereum chailletii]
MHFPLAFLSPLLATVVLAAPAPERINLNKRDVTPVSTGQLSSYSPFTQFARAAYCEPGKVEGWQCGEACSALPGFQPTLTGGDGNSVQYFFVGYWPEQNTVVVAHQGTDPTELYVPSVVHEGFADQHAQTAGQILGEVRNLMDQHNTNSITLIGHSLGGALAELDSLYMRLNIPNASVKGVTYGTPRVGNDDFASYFDGQVSDFTRITNRDDLIPIVPGRFLGFAHPHGEIHIIDDGDAVACSGSDNEDDQCITGQVGNIFEGNIIDHLGPYEGIYIGTLFCN